MKTLRGYLFAVLAALLAAMALGALGRIAYDAAQGRLYPLALAFLVVLALVIVDTIIAIGKKHQ
jgi:hypothetical protein